MSGAQSRSQTLRTATRESRLDRFAVTPSCAGRGSRRNAALQARCRERWSTCGAACARILGTSAQIHEDRRIGWSPFRSLGLTISAANRDVVARLIDFVHTTLASDSTRTYMRPGAALRANARPRSLAVNEQEPNKRTPQASLRRSRTALLGAQGVPAKFTAAYELPRDQHLAS